MSMLSRTMVSRTVAFSSSVSWSILVYNVTILVQMNAFLAVLIDLKPRNMDSVYFGSLVGVSSAQTWSPW